MARIALVEDNEDNRALIGAILEELHEIDEYEDGPSGLEGMRARPPDLALLDVSLPGMSGPQVLQAMKEDPALRAVPTVVITAHAMAGDRERYEAEGFDAYISKPIEDEQVLIDVITRLLGGA